MRIFSKILMAAFAALLCISTARAQTQNVISQQTQAQLPVPRQVQDNVMPPAASAPAQPATAASENLEDKIITTPDKTVPANPVVTATNKETPEDQYLPPTFENLAKLYWAVGKFTIDDDAAIDNYLRLTECDIFLQYYHNDFEWRKIREATRQYLLTHISGFPRRFELMEEIDLGRYDQAKQQFEIVKDSQQINVTRIDNLSNSTSEHNACTSGFVPGYPRNIIANLTHPFNLQVVPVEPQLAALYIDQVRLSQQGISNTNTYNVDYYKREAYLRLKIKMIQYKETSQANIVGMDRAVIYARVEGWDVYADPEETKPLFTHMLTKEELNAIPQRSAGSVLSLRPVGESAVVNKEYQPFK